MDKLKVKELIFFLIIGIMSISLVSSLGEQNVSDEIKNLKEDLNNIKDEGLPYQRLESMILEIEKTLEIIKNIEIVNNPNISYEEKREAKESIRLVNINDLNYQLLDKKILEAVDIYRMEIEAKDLLLLTKSEIDSYSLNRNYLELEFYQIYLEANKSFFDERFEETIQLSRGARSAIESQKIEDSFSKVLYFGPIEQIKENWKVLIVILVLSFILFYFMYILFKKLLIKRKIERLNIEKESLKDLIKEVQVKRFKQNLLSKVSYNIKIENYNKRLEEVKRKILLLKEKV